MAALSFDPQVLFVLIVALALSLSFHEAAHAWAAYRLGDDTAERQGRLSLNPLVHIDPIATVLLPAMLFLVSNGQLLFGGAKPVPVNPTRFRHPLRDNALVALAGPLSNIFLALVAALALHLVHRSGGWDGKLLPELLVHILQFNVLLAVFNLVPIPPLDGSRVVTWLLPDGVRSAYVQLESVGILLVIGLIYLVPDFRHALHLTIITVTNWVYDVVTLGGAW
jgi:Zn-dependent protease